MCIAALPFVPAAAAAAALPCGYAASPSYGMFQLTMFFKDPSGNSLEFKAMTQPGNLFAKYEVRDG
jgi:hypothetical protein